MDDLRTRLEHLATRVDDRTDAFVRLEHRRRARTRGRRASAGVLAVGIGVIGTLIAYSSLTTPHVGPPGGPGERIAALWPEHDAEQLRAIQEAVDAGDATLAWRLDPEETAVRFVRSILGWTEPDERLSHHGVEAPSGLVTVDVFTVPASCDEESCDVVRDVIVHLVQLGDEDGVWSVISAESPSFNMQFRIGQPVRVGDELDVIAGHPAGSEIAIGVKLFEPCSGFHGANASVQDFRVRVPIRDVEAGCLGYVYALTPAGGGNERGRTLFDDRSDPGPAIDDIAIAPVFVVSPDGSVSVSEVPQPEEA